MRITLHGHRPASLRSSAAPSRAEPGHAAVNRHAARPDETVQVIDLFCLKAKIYRRTSQQNSLLTQLRNRALLARWDAWEQAGGATGGDRAEARRRLRFWLNQNQADLPLSLAGLQLTSLPDLPASVRTLNIRNNLLSELPQLPVSLREINAAGNRLTRLPALPDSLERVFVYQNELSELPRLPVALRQLDAAENALTSLPDLPVLLEKLHVYQNQLSELPHLPASLQSLDAGENQLTHLPDLPDALETLHVTENQLSALPERLPARLRELDAAENQLLHLPDLPNALVRLAVFKNKLSELPQNLPDSLRFLHASMNGLTRLPPLPPHLEKLVVFQNELSELPDLPLCLREMDASENQLTRLPALPLSLEALRVENNQLSTLPANITQLSADCGIDLSNNPIRQHVRDRLTAAMNAPDYQGPQFVLSAPTVVRPLTEAVIDWYDVSDRGAVQTTWDAISNEEGAASFSEFLDRLRGTVNASHPRFKQAAAEWLSHLADHPQLRKNTFLISEEASTSCEDRVSLTFNDMKKARLVSDVERGDYDQRLPELVDLARGMFRLDKLEEIAQRQAASIADVDQIEVYLAYQVSLRERLDLPLDTSDMRFFDVSCVTPEDLVQAEQNVRTAEGQEFGNYLSTDWQPWQSVLKRLYPEAHAAAQDELIEALDERFAGRLRERLAAEGLANDSDAQRILGPQVQAGIAQEIMGPLTRGFLANQNLLHLLPPWYPVAVS